jgi:hypothetical protein
MSKPEFVWLSETKAPYHAYGEAWDGTRCVMVTITSDNRGGFAYIVEMSWRLVVNGCELLRVTGTAWTRGLALRAVKGAVRHLLGAKRKE